MGKMRDFFNTVGDAMGSLAMDGFLVKTVPDDVPYKEIEPHSYQFYAGDMTCIYTLRITEDGITLLPFWDQNGKQCVEDVDGTIYRIKSS